jgi:anti-sigma factor RsiW
MTAHPTVLLHAYLDNELEASRALDLHTHLEGCAECRDSLALALATQRAVRRLPREEPSAALLEKLKAPKTTHREPRRVRVMAFAGLAALLIITLWAAVDRSNADLERTLASAHARALVGAHLIDVASSDRHTVKPFFQGKVPFSLPVADFAEAGFTLEGGRIDAIGSTPAAVLVYRYQSHAIDVFVWPDESRRAPESSATRYGYHVNQFQLADLHVALVSDASDEVLQHLAGLIRALP